MMSPTHSRATRAKLQDVICVCVLGGILVAGLWPFHAPRNQVIWLTGANGLRFGQHGTILSSGPFQVTDSQPDSPCSIELLLQPDSISGGGTFLAFDNSATARHFSLHRSESDLLLTSETSDPANKIRNARLYIGDIFRPGKETFITVTAGGASMAVYIDGKLAGTSSQFPLSSKDLTGQLVISDSPLTEDSWSGRLRGVAFFDGALTPSQVLRHYVTWTRLGRPDIGESERNLALYLFDERGGSVVHNQVRSGVKLYIPERYMILHQVFLERPWDEYHPGWGYWKNVVINIAGFIPLGFVFCAYFAGVRRIERAIVASVIVGAAVSLTIEVLQAYLPTRDSGMTDLITNTLGTGLGAMLYRARGVQALYCEVLSRLSFAKPS